MTPAPVARGLLAVLVAACLASGLACGGDGAEVDARASEPQAPAAEPVKAEAQEHAKRAERPLPAFGGWTLDGKRLQISSLIGKRLLIFFFNPEVDAASVVGTAVGRVSQYRGDHNFEIVGVATGSDPDTARAFAKKHGIDYQVIDDSSAAIARRLGLRVPMALLGVDSQGYVIFGLGQFATDAPQAEKIVESQLRTALRLPDEEQQAAAGKPVAPPFEAPVLDSDETFRLADQRGRAVVLVFFLHTCPHCHEFLQFMKQELADMPEDKRPVLVGVEVTGKTYAVRDSLKKLGLDFFPVLFDDDGSIRDAYGVFAGVPDTFLIDREGRIAAHVQGWMPETDAPLMRMRMAKAAGAPVPMLLRPKGYSGNDVCGVCHESEHQTWLITQHASAYDTLVKHGADSDTECVGCHVVGFGKEGGFEIEARMPALEDVGCESCHGRGGPHLSPEFVSGGSYESVCLGCHDTKHSLGFEYASFLPRVSHAANAAILAMPAEERDRILAERGAVRKDLLPTGAAYVGSEACVSCHAAEHGTWASGPHARAMKSLADAGKAGDPDCQRCHTTAFGRPEGFVAGSDPSEQSDLARVGCESCHGPGGAHVAEGAKRIGTIVSLGDKCDSCVILQICGSCHDDANDPGFEFEVEAKIDRIRHGTIEPGTGKPLEDRSARGLLPKGGSHGDSELYALLSRAFAAADGAAVETDAWTAR